MAKKMIRPVIDVETFYACNATIHEVFGKVYAQIFRDKLKIDDSTPLKSESNANKMESS